MYKPEQFEKLPKWAQTEISVLEMRVRELNETIQQLSSDSNTKVVAQIGSEHKLYLPNNTHVKFFVGSGPFDYIEIGLRVNRDESKNVYVNTGHGMIAVLPTSGNAVYIEQDKR